MITNQEIANLRTTAPGNAPGTGFSTGQHYGFWFYVEEISEDQESKFINFIIINI